MLVIPTPGSLRQASAVCLGTSLGCIPRSYLKRKNCKKDSTVVSGYSSGAGGTNIHALCVSSAESFFL